jgi:hypothetical protein
MGGSKAGWPLAPLLYGYLAQAPYARFLESFVLPNMDLFAGHSWESGQPVWPLH